MSTVIMNQEHKRKSRFISSASGNPNSFRLVLRSKYFYIGLISILVGYGLNFTSQIYLVNCIKNGITLPVLSDLILDNLPYYNISLIYDIFYLSSIAVVLIYWIHRKDYERIPFFLILCGIFFIVRGIFIVLTPFGNPPMFKGSNMFKEFSQIEVGVYPSGHAGSLFLFFLLVKDKWYKRIIFFCLVMVIISLCLSRGHYSIDIFSGIIFAYAINAFGEKHLKMFDLDNKNDLKDLKTSKEERGFTT
jgi:membrane-associated phospholipid phosphatase